ncbi:MAG: type II secretion system F family protein, partial [Acidimicrobiia bacterium]|nr:type II secretion system F family protein [Acidimicrobiia bacterium]
MVSSSLLAASASAGLACLIMRAIVPPRRLLAGRVRPYASLSRSRLGTGYADASVATLIRHDDRTAIGRVFGPVLSQWAEYLGSLVDAADHDTLRRRLRNAGFVDTDPAQYRMRQLVHTIGGITGGVAIGLALGDVPLTVLFMICLGFYGATLQRSRLTAATEKRAQRMWSEVYTIAQLLAVRLRTGSGPVDAVRSVCQVARGAVVAELNDALSWISSGTAVQHAFDKLAEAADEPAAARLYRLLAASSNSGGDIAGALLS